MQTERALPRAYRLPEDNERGATATTLPRCVFFEVTNRCNLTCTSCPHTFVKQEEPHDLTLEEFEAFAAQFPDMERAVLHGIGEPLLNRRLPEMIRLLKGRSISVLFNSNATLLSQAWQEDLVLSGLDEYRVSLDSAEPAEYARIHGKPLFQRVVRNLSGLVRTRQRLGAETPRISIWCVGMKENLGQMPGLIRLAAEVGVTEVYVQRLTYFIDSGSRRGLAKADQAVFGNLSEEDAEVIGRCEELAQELGILFRASGAVDPRHSLYAAQSPDRRPWMSCVRPWTTAYITANGNALPCCISPFATTHYADLILGNVWQRGFSEVWNGECYQDWRRALLSASPPEPCRGCGSYWSL